MNGAPAMLRNGTVLPPLWPRLRLSVVVATLNALEGPGWEIHLIDRRPWRFRHRRPRDS